MVFDVADFEFFIFLAKFFIKKFNFNDLKIVSFNLLYKLFFFLVVVREQRVGRNGKLKSGAC